MKKIFLISVLSFFVSSAMAADTAVMKVNGKLTNASCTPELSDGGVVDFGYVYLGQLSATESNPLPEKSIDLTITCTSPTKVAWDGLDNQASTLPSPALKIKQSSGTMTTEASRYLYGMGETDAGVKIGNYDIFVDHTPDVDGKSGATIGRETDWKSTIPWNVASDLQQSDQMEWLSVAEAGTNVPVAFTNAKFHLKVRATIQDTTTLAITDDTKINGQATFTLHYL